MIWFLAGVAVGSAVTLLLLVGVIVYLVMRIALAHRPPHDPVSAPLVPPKATTAPSTGVQSWGVAASPHLH